MTFRFRLVLIAASSLSFLTAFSSAQTANCIDSSDDEAVRSEMNLGVEAYKSANYSEAIDHFQKATKLAPCLTMARAYLATAQAQNVIPSLNTPENSKMAENAIANFMQVLAEDPHDINSMKQIAAVYLSTLKLNDAREWQKKVLVENPQDWEASYAVGVIDWQQAHINAIKLLSSAGLQDDGEGNRAAPPDVLESIARQNNALVEEGLQYLTQAIEDHANYDDAMAYLNLVYRRKADIDYQNPTLRDDDVAKAKEWGHKAMQTRKEKEEKKVASPGSSQP